MADAFEVNTEDLRTDAETWTGWSDSVEAAGTAVPTIGNGLDLFDFSFLPGAQSVATAYQTAATALANELADGAATMQGVAEKLNSVATRYENVEQENEDAINGVDPAEGVWV